MRQKDVFIMREKKCCVIALYNCFDYNCSRQCSKAQYIILLIDVCLNVAFLHSMGRGKRLSIQLVQKTKENDFLSLNYDRVY